MVQDLLNANFRDLTEDFSAKMTQNRDLWPFANLALSYSEGYKSIRNHREVRVCLQGD